MVPLLLVTQVWMFSQGDRRLRLSVSVLCSTAIAAMFVLVAVVMDTPPGDANIGAGLLLLELIGSLALLRAGVARASSRPDARRRTSPD